MKLLRGGELRRGVWARRVPWRWIILGESGFPVILLLLVPLLVSPVVRGLWSGFVERLPFLDGLMPYLVFLLLLAVFLPIALRLSGWIRGRYEGVSDNGVVKNLDRRERS